MSRVLIDACKPFTWADRFPMSNKFSAEKRREIAEKWSRDFTQLSRVK
jgi:hypothetical protein